MPIVERPHFSDSLVDLLADVAALATADEATATFPDVLARLAGASGAAACQLDATTTGVGWHTAASVEYPDEVGRHLGNEFLDSRHGQLVLEHSGGQRIGDDDRHGFRQSVHFRDVLRPAGFEDGISLALRSPHRDMVGVLHLSACATRDFAPDVMTWLPPLGRALARATQLASCSSPDVTLPRDYAAARLDSTGRTVPVVGRDRLHLDLDTAFRELVRAVLATGTEFATFLHQQEGRLIEVRLHAPHLTGGRRSGERRGCTIATRPASSTLGLTLRQLEVLTAVATGAGNREIADEFCLTPRTVAAHVEAILTRLETPSRAGAAAKATAAGILLPSADPRSVRSVTQILRRPTGTPSRP
jgi:DNA-binding CsgD family transcriptional regulator